ncbi:MAG: S49 family peptidase [Hymenobacter sp.]
MARLALPAAGRLLPLFPAQPAPTPRPHRSGVYLAARFPHRPPTRAARIREICFIRKICDFMRQFFKFVLATVVGLLVFSILGFVLLAGLAAAVGSSGPSKTVAANSVLELKLDKPISERKESADFNPFGGAQATIGLVELRDAIRRAKTDGDIKGILLNLELVQGGMASLEEIRDALLDFKKDGKFIVAYHEIASEKSYYLSSVADQIYLHPQGTLEFNGLSSEVMFYKRLFEKAGIEPYIFRVGSFKSAVEPFFRENFSDSARYQTVSVPQRPQRPHAEPGGQEPPDSATPPARHLRLDAGAQRPRRAAAEAGDQARLLR